MITARLLCFPGRELIELPPEEMARWVAATDPSLVDQYTNEKTALGLPAADYEAYLLERTEYWSQRTPTEASCVEWVQKELVE